MKRILLVLLLLAPAAHAGIKYMTRTGASGYSGGDGTQGSPYSVEYVGLGNVTLTPGDTIYVDSDSVYATYGGEILWRGNSGTSGSPIKILPAPGRTVTWYALSGYTGSSIITVDSNYTWLKDFIFDCKTDSTSTSWVDGVRFNGSNNKLINCFIRNTTNNAIADQDGGGTEVYGNIIQYAGRRHSGGNAYASYIQNYGGKPRKYYTANVVVNDFADAYIHGYSTNEQVDSITFTNNVLMSTLDRDGDPNLLLGASPGPSGIIIDSSYHYGNWNSIGGPTYSGAFDAMGYQELKGVISPTLRYNYYLKSTISIRASTTGPSGTGNICWGGWPTMTQTNDPDPPSVWYASITEGVDTIDSYGFTWYVLTGGYPTKPSINAIRMIPNKYQANRGLLVVINLDSSASVTVPAAELAKILSNNDSFYVYDTQNYRGGAVASGKWTTGSTYSLSMTQTTIHAPYSVPDEQGAFGNPTHTDRMFNAFVVTTTGLGGEGGGEQGSNYGKRLWRRKW